ncbi:MAG: amidohydrolase family protein [Polyangiaceae bacterium]|nr:amidohydrolase family protein [Polyangiaceae bacterium]
MSVACSRGSDTHLGRAPAPTGATTPAISAPPSAIPSPTVGPDDAGSSSAGAKSTPVGPDWANSPAFESQEPVDLIIRGGKVIDGTGAGAVAADVVVDAGRIVHLGRVAPEVRAARQIDARGLAVTPGFIDMHSHAVATGPNRNLLAMGVTTVVVGQDGRSPTAGPIAHWFARLRRTRLSVNVAALAGHATLRGLAGVYGSPPNDKALERLASLIGRELRAGAFGLSTALEYQPGAQAGRQELHAVARAVAEHDGIIMSHLRSEDDDLIDTALDELLSQGEQGARVHVAHIKVVYGKGTARADALLAKMQAARDDGIELTADLYPYDASYTTTSILFPPFAKPPASFQQARSRRREELREFLRNKVRRRGGPQTMLLGTGPYAGKTLEQIASAKGKPFEDVLIDDIGPGGASAAYFVMDHALQSRLLVDPWIMIGTDGGEYSNHPRGHGSFARVLAEHVRERKALTLIEAVRKMSGLCARTLRLHARGTLRPGSAADILVFDPAQVQDHATYAEPHQHSTGMRWVVVNGRIAVEEGRFTGTRAGRLLLSERKSGSSEDR